MDALKAAVKKRQEKKKEKEKENEKEGCPLLSMYVYWLHVFVIDYIMNINNMYINKLNFWLLYFKNIYLQCKKLDTNISKFILLLFPIYYIHWALLYKGIRNYP